MFTKLFSPNVEKIVLHNAVFRLLLLDPFQRYSRSKSTVVQNLVHRNSCTYLDEILDAHVS